jgi:hypothetical protein
MAGDRHGRRSADGRLPPLQRSTRRWAGCLGADRAGAWEAAQGSDEAIGRSATPSSARPGWRPARRPTGSGWLRPARGWTPARCRGRAVPDRRRRRAEGPDRGRCLGLGPRAGKLARRSRRDRGRARRSGLRWAALTALLGRTGRTRTAQHLTLIAPARHRHRLRGAGGLWLGRAPGASRRWRR